MRCEAWVKNDGPGGGYIHCTRPASGVYKSSSGREEHLCSSHMANELLNGRGRQDALTVAFRTQEESRLRLEDLCAQLAEAFGWECRPYQNQLAKARQDPYAECLVCVPEAALAELLNMIGATS